MRKIFALMLAIAMVLTMVACGKKADNKADSMVTPELYISTVDGKDTVVDKDGKAVTGYTLDKDGNVVDGSGKLDSYIHDKLVRPTQPGAAFFRSRIHRRRRRRSGWRE